MAEYPRLFAEDPLWLPRADAFAQRVIDFSAFVAQAERAERLNKQLAPLAPRKVAWDDPCHLCHGQGITAEPRALLDLIPGIERVEMPGAGSCCGSAGIHALLYPAESNQLLDAKLEEFTSSEADVLITANPGCQMQWHGGFSRTGKATRPQHLAEILAASLAQGPQVVSKAKPPKKG